MRLAGLFAAAAAAALATNAWAGCELRVQPSSDNWRIEGYDPFEGKPAVGQFDATFINTGDAPCVGELQTDLRGERYGLTIAGKGDKIPYALIDETTQSDLTPRTGKSAKKVGGAPITIPAGGRELRRFTVVAEPENVPGAGDYGQTVFLSVETDRGLPLSERPVTLALNVASTAVMGLKGSFTPTVSGGLVQLGELAEGQVHLPLHLYVKSTGSYRVTVASANLGKLRLGSSNWTVGYNLAVGEQAIDLEQGGQLQVTSSKAQNDQYPLTIQIQGVKGKRAGAYSDTVTFTVAAI